MSPWPPNKPAQDISLPARHLDLSLLEAIFIRNLEPPSTLQSPSPLSPPFSPQPSTSASVSSSCSLQASHSRHLWLRNILVDSFLSLSLPTIPSLILKTPKELGSSNPSFTIDLDRALDSSRLHPTIFANKHLIRSSYIIQITLSIRDAYPIAPPTRTRPRIRTRVDPHNCAGLEDDNGRNWEDDEDMFRPAFQWTVDLHELVCLGKADSDTILFPPPTTSPDAPNQLYLQLADEIYLFQPTPLSPSSDLDRTHSQPPAGPEQHETVALPSERPIEDGCFENMKTKDSKIFRISDAINLYEKQIELTTLMSEISDIESGLKQTSKTASSRNQTGFHLSRRLHEIDHNINQLNSTQTLIGNRLDELKEELRQRDDMIARRRSTLETARSTLASLVDVRISGARRQLIEERVPQQRACRRALEVRRAELVRALDTVFPITPVTGADAPLLFSIAGVPLRPLDTGPAVEDERAVASALGLVAQLTTLVAMYLAVPMLYPISCIGSRSVVSDYVSRIKGPRSFPLYFKGVDRYRFEYAVFLLNKDIEQIMYHRQVTVSDLRHTLPNLKNLLLTVETSCEVVGNHVCCTRDTEAANGSVQIDDMPPPTRIVSRPGRLKEEPSEGKERAAAVAVAPVISITKCGSDERSE